jgi:zinc protease
MKALSVPALLALAALSCAAQAPAPKKAPAQRTTPPAPTRATPAQRSVPAAPPPASPADLKYPPLKPVSIPNVATFTLPNGIKVYLLEDRELPLISGVALVRTGNLFDPPDKVGLAEITGTTIRTGGTKNVTGDEWNVKLEDMASTVESAIGETSGSVSFSSLKENAAATMAIFKAALTAPEFRQEKIDLAKLEIDSGISRRNDEPGPIAEREFTDIVYGRNTPYGWQEEYATIGRITRADIQDFYSRYYFPKNVMLAVWGDFDTAAMKADIEKLFADWTVERQPVPPFPKVRTAAAPGVYQATKHDVTQTFFAIGQLGGEARDKDYPALEVMSRILGGGFQSRLFQRVRTKMGAAYDIGADWAAKYDHPGLFEISGSTRSASTVETIRAALEEVERIRSAEVSEDELKTARETAVNSFVFAFDSRTKTLGRMLTYEYYGYPKDFIQQYQKALEAVTRADVLRVAKEHLDPAAFTIVTVGNPDAYVPGLSALGSTVHPIDLTIPPPEEPKKK